jgi:uncharacterized protein with HEPN domain
MPRSAAAHIADVVDACDAITEVLLGVDLETCSARRPIRSAVEREFAIFGEAVSALMRQDPELAVGISHAPYRRVPQPDRARVPADRRRGRVRHRSAQRVCPAS